MAKDHGPRHVQPQPFVKDMDAVKTQLEKLKVSGIVCACLYSHNYTVDQEIFIVSLLV
jgi:hypothetical protein